MTTPAGLCQCGCGQVTSVPRESNASKGDVRGAPRRYVHGHQPKGEASPHFRGGIHNGYRRVKSRGVTRLEHVVIVEAALGRPLRHPENVHHVDGVKSRNVDGNLVVCPDLGYHKLLERRTRALAACGHPAWLKCPFCKQYDDPARMYVPKGPRRSARHRECANAYNRKARSSR